MIRVVIGFAAAMAAVSIATAETRTFKDWEAVCERGECIGRTVAASGPLASSTLEVKRGSGAGTEWEIVFRLSADLPKNAALRLTIDGEPGPLLEPLDYSAGPEGVALVAPDVLRTLVPILRNKGRLVLAIEPQDGRVAEFSLSGMAATLLWIDERQGRVVGQTPEVAARRRTPGMPEEIRRVVAAEPVCNSDEQENPADMETVKLDEERTLYIAPCWSAAYNFGYLLFAKPGADGSELQPLAFAFYSKEDGWMAERVLVNATYDPQTRTLTSFNKGRGLGDCGVLASWRWTKNGFSLRKIQAESECRERLPAEWPVLFEAR